MSIEDRIRRRHIDAIIAGLVIIAVVLAIAAVYWLFTGEWILK
jgi:hypothetical protein